MARRSVAIGEVGEHLTRIALVQYGLVMVEKVNTPWKPVRREGKIISAHTVEKVSGDFIAMVPGTGRKVLVESKARKERVRWSDLKPHQKEALDTNAGYGGLSLLSIITDPGICLFQWPVAGFGPGRSLGWSDRDRAVYSLSFTETTGD